MPKGLNRCLACEVLWKFPVAVGGRSVSPAVDAQKFAGVIVRPDTVPVPKADSATPMEVDQSGRSVSPAAPVDPQSDRTNAQKDIRDTQKTFVAKAGLNTDVVMGTDGRKLRGAGSASETSGPATFQEGGGSSSAAASAGPAAPAVLRASVAKTLGKDDQGSGGSVSPAVPAVALHQVAATAYAKALPDVVAAGLEGLSSFQEMRASAYGLVHKSGGGAWNQWKRFIKDDRRHREKMLTGDWKKIQEELRKGSHFAFRGYFFFGTSGRDDSYEPLSRKDVPNQHCWDCEVKHYSRMLASEIFEVPNPVTGIESVKDDGTGTEEFNLRKAILIELLTYAGDPRKIIVAWGNGDVQPWEPDDSQCPEVDRQVPLAVAETWPDYVAGPTEGRPKCNTFSAVAREIKRVAVARTRDFFAEVEAKQNPNLKKP